MLNIDSRDKKRLLYNVVIVRLADELGYDGLSNRLGCVISKSKMNKIRSDLSEIPEHLLGEEFDKIARTPWDYDDLKIIKMFGLVKKDFYRKQVIASKLTSNIKSSFLKSINNEKLSKKEIFALKHAGLIDDRGDITKLGMDFSYLSKPLYAQCEYLGVRVIEHQTQFSSGSIEQCVALDLSREGGDWFFSENHLWEFLINNLSKPLISQLNKLHPPRKTHVTLNELNKLHSPARSEEIFGLITDLYERTSLKSIYRISCLIGLDLEKEFLTLFTKEYFSDKVKELYVRKVCFRHSEIGFKKRASDMYINEVDVNRIFNTVGYDKFLKILERYLAEPSLCIQGWPDLIGLDCGKVKFVEVKRKDKFTIGQLTSLRFVNELFDNGVEVRVAKL
jgi:hypothetical protein